MFEYRSLTKNLSKEQLFDKAALDLEEHDVEANMMNDQHFCSASEYAHLNNLFAQSALFALGEDKMEESKMINEFLHYLVLHHGLLLSPPRRPLDCS